MHKNALLKGCSTLVAMVTTAASWRPGASFSYKNVAKKRVNFFLYLKLSKQLQIGTSTIHSNIILLHFDAFHFPWEWMWIHQYIIYLGTVSVIFCCRVKQGKRLSEFLQTYNDSGTETTDLAGYNILVFKYVKISAGLLLLFIGAISEKSSKSDIA